MSDDHETTETESATDWRAESTGTGETLETALPGDSGQYEGAIEGDASVAASLPSLDDVNLKNAKKAADWVWDHTLGDKPKKKEEPGGISVEFEDHEETTMRSSSVAHEDPPPPPQRPFEASRDGAPLAVACARSARL